jgi:hypothetical protein
MVVVLRAITLALLVILFAEGLAGVLAKGDAQSWMLMVAAPFLFVGKIFQGAIWRWISSLGEVGTRRLNYLGVALVLLAPLLIVLPVLIGRARGH